MSSGHRSVTQRLATIIVVTLAVTACTGGGRQGQTAPAPAASALDRTASAPSVAPTTSAPMTPGTSSTGSVRSASPQSTRRPTTPAEIDAAIRFRTETGLVADREYVERAARDPVLFPVVEFGPPLSRPEAAQIEQQIDGGDDRAVLYALGQPDYAGMYLDAGVPVFLFAGDAERHRSVIERLLPTGRTFDLRSASRTHTELAALQEDVSDSFEALDAEGIPVTGVGVDPETNTVRISLAWYTSEFERRLRERFGDSITVEGEGPPPPPGPTQTPDLAAKGIRLLADEASLRTIGPEPVVAATVRGEFQRQWRQLFPTRRVPRVAFEREVVIVLHASVESGCTELLFAGLDVDMEQRIVTGRYVKPWTGKTSCHDQADTHTFVIAVERGRLPTGEVTIRLEDELYCDGECTAEDGQIKVRL